MAAKRDNVKNPRSAPKPEDEQKLAEERAAALRREKHALAHDVAPGHAGNELLDGSPEREAKRKEAEEGAKQAEKDAKK